MRRVAFIVSGLLLSGWFLSHGVYAETQTSAHFQASGEAFVPAAFVATSSHYGLHGSLEVLVGETQGSDFRLRTGSSFSGSASSSESVPPLQNQGVGIGGLGQGIPPQAPVFSYRSPTFLSHQIIRGRRQTPDVRIFVNGSESEVVLFPDSSWERDVPLRLGMNVIVVQARTGTGSSSGFTSASIERRAVGDVDGNRVVDDVDLSLFTRSWQTFDRRADFNEDGLVDDLDLSLLVSHWGLSWL